MKELGPNLAVMLMYWAFHPRSCSDIMEPQRRFGVRWLKQEKADESICAFLTAGLQKVCFQVKEPLGGRCTLGTEHVLHMTNAAKL